MMRRLSLLVVAVSILTACSTTPRPEQGAPATSGGLRPPEAGQISPAKPEQTTTQSPASTSPAPTTPVPTSPAPTSPPVSECVYPKLPALQAQGSLLKADGAISFYQYPCTSGETWVAIDGIVWPFPSKEQGIRGVKPVNLPAGQRGYLMWGKAETPSASAYFLLVVKDGKPHLYHFDGGQYGDGVLYGGEAILSTDDPEIQGDRLEAAQRMGASTYETRRYQLNPQTLTATLIK